MAVKKNSKRFFIGIAVALLLPLFCYFLVSKMVKGKIQLPAYYIVEKVETVVKNGVAVADTIYHKTNELELVNQVGETRKLNTDLKGRILVLDFFFASCKTTCPRLAKSMQTLQKGFRRDPKKASTLENSVHFISITVMPEHDSFQVLRMYADKYGANPDHWWFMTGDKKAIYNYIRNELQLAAGAGDGGVEDLIHTEKLVLLDQDRFVRGYYNGLNDTSVRKCADDIVLLTLEKKRKKK